MTTHHQPGLPLVWYAPHEHGDDVHQHFLPHGAEGDHEGVPLVPFDPTQEAGGEDLKAVLTSIRRTNQEIFRRMRANRAQPDPNSVLLIRLETVIDVLLGVDGPERTRFEIYFEKKMTEILTSMEEQSRAALLRAPVQMPGQNGFQPGGFILPPGARP